MTNEQAPPETEPEDIPIEIKQDMMLSFENDKDGIHLVYLGERICTINFRMLGIGIDAVGFAFPCTAEVDKVTHLSISEETVQRIPEAWVILDEVREAIAGRIDVVEKE